jgi:hypothetical protein
MDPVASSTKERPKKWIKFRFLESGTSLPEIAPLSASTDHFQGALFSEPAGSRREDRRFGSGKSCGQSAEGIAQQKATARSLLAKAKTGWYFYRVSRGSPAVRFISGAIVKAGWLPYSG